jgi:3-deoxy-7-phosphoheptulonate synthase
MLIVMKSDCSEKEINAVKEKIIELGYKAEVIPGKQRIAIGILGNEGSLDELIFKGMDGVSQAIPVTKPYKLVSREFNPADLVIKVKDHIIDSENITIIAGPCAVENEEMIFKTADFVKKAGAHILRGGVFKPRTSPYSFQGLGKEGLKLLCSAGQSVNLPIITEVLDTENVDLVAEYTDILQIGARNMQNYSLLRKVGKTSRPVMLKRGMSATIEEFLMAAEYIMSEGNREVILCERGIRTFGTHTRNTLDITAIPVIKEISHLPIFIDPSHATGYWDKVLPAARAGVAIGANGLMIEVHPDPKVAKSDGPQSLKFEKFTLLMDELKIIAKAVNKKL